MVERLKRRVRTRDDQRRESSDDELLAVVRYRDRDDRTVTTIDCYLSNAAPGVSPAERANAAKAEHRIEECLRRGKSEAALADYEVRTWVGWQYHLTLSLLAGWFLTTETLRGKTSDPGADRAADPDGDRASPALRPRRRRPGARPLRLQTPPRPQRAGAAAPLVVP